MRAENKYSDSMFAGFRSAVEAQATCMNTQGELVGERITLERLLGD